MFNDFQTPAVLHPLSSMYCDPKNELQVSDTWGDDCCKYVSYQPMTSFFWTFLSPEFFCHLFCRFKHIPRIRAQALERSRFQSLDKASQEAERIDIYNYTKKFWFISLQKHLVSYNRDEAFCNSFAAFAITQLCTSQRYYHPVLALNATMFWISEIPTIMRNCFDFWECSIKRST